MSILRGLKTSLLVSALVLGGLYSAPASAETITYALTFTSTSGASTGGQGTLTLNLPSPTSTSGYSFGGSSSMFESLTATVDSIPFTFTMPEIFSIGINPNGSFNNLSAESAFVSSGSVAAPPNNLVQLQLNGPTSPYDLHVNNNGDLEDGTLTIGPAVIASATPLPATLPLFAGGLGFVGYLTRRKRNAKQEMAAA
jgi:hypothetical protein